jgi:hypothetical protein
VKADWAVNKILTPKNGLNSSYWQTSSHFKQSPNADAFFKANKSVTFHQYMTIDSFNRFPGAISALPQDCWQVETEYCNNAAAMLCA